MAIDFLERCDAIEECYEFMLAYAGQGLPTDQAASPEDRSANFCRAPCGPDGPGRELFAGCGRCRT